MDPAIRTLLLPPLPPDRAEILRYALLPANAPVPQELPLDECIDRVRGRVRCRAVWREYPLALKGDMCDLGFATVRSVSLAKHLRGAEAIVLMACTAGAEMDRLIARAALRSPTHALLTHAIGDQQVEAGADRLCAMLTEQYPGRTLTGRFSPGYGDLPLDLQKDVTEALSCGLTIGVSMSESSMLKPVKTVTAIIGIARREETCP